MELTESALLQENELVRVYWNLHKKCFSIQKKVVGRWKVVEHSKRSFVLKDVFFKVYQAGREKVLREKTKNVHAYVCGRFSLKKIELENRKRISYNPYLYDFFFDVSRKEKIENVDYLILTNNQDIRNIKPLLLY